MSDSVDTGAVTAGPPQVREQRSTSFLGNDALSALNICFLFTTVAGIGFEFFDNVVGAISVMAIFLAYGFFFRKEVPNMERFADSAYYQGFILTLFALLFALTGKGSHAISSDSIIQKFGLAIWTTCIGMTGRIFIIQFLTTVRDEDEKARQSISEYVEQLNIEVKTTLAQLRAFRTTVLEAAANVSDDLADESKRSRKEASEAIKTALGALVKSIENSGKKVDQSVEEVAKRLAEIDIPTDAVSARLQAAATAMDVDLKRLREGLENGADGFAGVLKDNVAVLENTKADLSSLRAKILEVNTLIENSSVATKKSLEETSGSLKSASEANAGVQQLATTAGRLADLLTAVSDKLDEKAKSHIADLDRANKDIYDAYVEGAGKIKQAIRETQP